MLAEWDTWIHCGSSGNVRVKVRINMDITRSLSIGIFSTEVSPHSFGLLRIRLSRPLSPKYQYFYSCSRHVTFTQQIVTELGQRVKPCARGSGRWKIKCCPSLQELVIWRPHYILRHYLVCDFWFCILKLYWISSNIFLVEFVTLEKSFPAYKEDIYSLLTRST